MAEQQATRLEAARTNSLTRSEEFDHGDWSKVQLNVTPDDAEAPDGTVTADRLESTSSTGRVGTYQGLASVSAGNQQATSFFVRKDTGVSSYSPWVWVGDRGDSSFHRSWINTDTGAVGTEENADRTIVEDRGDHWKITVVHTAIADHPYQPMVALADNDGADAATSGNFINAWGAQAELGASFPSSYIPTTSSTVTRAADDLSWGYTADPQAATLYGKLNLRHIDTLGTLVHIGDETDGMRVEVDASNNLVAKLFDGGSTASSSVAIGHSFDDTVEWRAVYGSDGSVTAHVAVNGGSESSGSTDSSQSLPSSFGSANITIGAEQDGTNPCNGDYLAFQKSPGDRTLAEMQSLAGQS